MVLLCFGINPDFKKVSSTSPLTKGTYQIIPCTFNPDEVGGFTLSIYSSVRFFFCIPFSPPFSFSLSSSFLVISRIVLLSFSSPLFSLLLSSLFSSLSFFLSGYGSSFELEAVNFVPLHGGDQLKKKNSSSSSSAETKSTTGDWELGKINWSDVKIGKKIGQVILCFCEKKESREGEKEKGNLFLIFCFVCLYQIF